MAQSIASSATPPPQRRLARWAALFATPSTATPAPACGDHVVILANPRAGGQTRESEDLRAVVAYLRQYVAHVELRLTELPGEATRLAEQAVREGATAVIAAGGDGTLNEVAQALAGTEVALGCLPMGTVNVWAREIGMPFSPLRAAAEWVSGERRVIDAGRVNGHIFLLMASVGLDAEVAHIVERQRGGGGLRKLARYVPLVIQFALRYRGARVEINVDGQRRALRALMVVVSNARLYGGAFAFSPEAHMNDGALDVAVIQDQSLIERALVFALALLRRPARDHKVRYWRGERITLRSNSRMRVQVDGEDFGRLPITIEVMPQALRVLVPARLPAGAPL